MRVCNIGVGILSSLLCAVFFFFFPCLLENCLPVCFMLLHLPGQSVDNTRPVLLLDELVPTAGVMLCLGVKSDVGNL